jgi:hypothetical protein
MLAEWRTVTYDRDNRARRAVSAGVSRYRTNQLTGIGRPTTDRTLTASAPAGTSIGPAGGVTDQ